MKEMDDNNINEIEDDGYRPEDSFIYKKYLDDINEAKKKAAETLFNKLNSKEVDEEALQKATAEFIAWNSAQILPAERYDIDFMDHKADQKIDVERQVNDLIEDYDLMRLSKRRCLMRVCPRISIKGFRITKPYLHPKSRRLRRNVQRKLISLKVTGITD